jgi:hypothetical protein
MRFSSLFQLKVSLSSLTIIFLATVLVPVLSSQRASAQTELDLTAKKAKAFLETSIPEKADSAWLESIWNKLSDKIDESYLALRPANQKLSGYQSLMVLEKKRLFKLLSKMQESGQIRLMTPEAEATLGLDRYLCSEGKRCKELRSFYLPLTHHIVLKKSLSEDLLVDSLFHELIHAEQFAYRFPLDIKTLSTLNIPRNDLLSFLDYYYESQANYRTLRLSQPKEWEPIFRASESQFTLGVAVTSVICIPCIAALTFGRMYSNHQALSYLPKIDMNSEPGWYKPTGGKESALYLTELLLLKDSDQTPLTGTGWDTHFHQRFGKAIERTYFDELRFLFQNNRKDQEAYKALHDAYYEKIGTRDDIDTNPACGSLLEKTQSAETSPLVSWLSLPLSEIESCQAFQGPGKLDYRSVYLQELLRMKEGESSPFIIIRPGSEGTRPDLRILPQLKVTPLEKSEETRK